VATALLAPVLAPYDPIKIKSSDRLQAPSLSHLLGTDDFGRDILSRVIYGARISIGLRAYRRFGPGHSRGNLPRVM
jgi:peptide/nickel transport system permease protein